MQQTAFTPWGKREKKTKQKTLANVLGISGSVLFLTSIRSILPTGEHAGSWASDTCYVCSLYPPVILGVHGIDPVGLCS